MDDEIGSVRPDVAALPVIEPRSSGKVPAEVLRHYDAGESQFGIEAFTGLAPDTIRQDILAMRGSEAVARLSAPGNERHGRSLPGAHAL